MISPNLTRNARILRLTLFGLSASEISFALGLQSRNVVVGVWDRNLTSEQREHVASLREAQRALAAKPAKPTPKPKAPREATPPKPAKALQAAKLRKVPEAIQAKAVPAAIPIRQVQIPRRERGQSGAPDAIASLSKLYCRYPIGDPRLPDFRFCGDPVETIGKPYCRECGSVAYVPALGRRRVAETAPNFLPSRAEIRQ